MLLAAEAKGEHVFCNFNGTILHSSSVSMDSAYMAVLGCTKVEYDKIQKERELLGRRERMQEIEEKNIKGNIPSWIEKSEALIFPGRYEEWEKCVKTRSNDLYNGTELEAALEIMTALENGATIEEAKQIFDNRGYSGMVTSLVRNIVFAFSSKGPEFWEATSSGKISLKDRLEVKEKKKENIQLAEANKEKENTRNICKKSPGW